jgi:N-acetylneuraminic acid mutarotase
MYPRQLSTLAAAWLLSGQQFVSAAPKHRQNTTAGWADLAQISRPRQEHVTVAINETIIAVLGGVLPVYDGDAEIGLETTDWLQLYDIPSDTWISASPLPYRVNHPNAAVVDQKIYLLGGLVDVVEPPGAAVDWEASGDSFVYDPATDSWTELEAMPPGTERGSAVTGVREDIIYVAGGMTVLNTEYQDAVSSVIAFNTTSGAWQRLHENAANIPSGRQHALGAVVGNTLYVVGGRWFEKINVRADVFMLNLDHEEEGWSTADNAMPTARGGIYGAVADGKIFVFGGEANPDSENGVFSQVEAFDLESRTWEELPDMPVPRHGSSAVGVGHSIYIPGGGLQEDGLPLLVDGQTQLLDTSNHFDVYTV